MQVTWTHAERRIEGAMKRRALIAWTPDHGVIIKHVRDFRNYNGQISATWRHHTRRSRGAWTTRSRSTHVLIKGALKRLRFDRADRISAVQSRSKGRHQRRFINVNLLIKSWPSITIRWPRLNRNGPRWTVSS